MAIQHLYHAFRVVGYCYDKAASSRRAGCTYSFRKAFFRGLRRPLLTNLGLPGRRLIC
ncbi:hypothetical protein T10_7557 [Trichinella papuae]|uniref:Uncharacterized protein n=1 Tax=Trichinella papuae TaxID=268474 RepID=A0A0V1MGZ7_9BILA|nr:hypothetical protein T10_7557 [Trichinella papuae]